MTAGQIRTWIIGLALVTLTIGVWSVSGSAYETTGVAALVLIGALIAVRTLMGAPTDRSGQNARPAPAYVRVRNNGVGRQVDPDAPGRARPRAPGCSADF
ncbi:MAG TPA: DUF6412 domain-containing protein [Micromonosporaceae bacterium]|jgi:hypothetical protein